LHTPLHLITVGGTIQIIVMQLSKNTLPQISAKQVEKPPMNVFALPEKVLQFGTGVLLRGLPDYFIDKANRIGLFNGRIVVVKSTDAGDAYAFDAQDGLYTLCIRGISSCQNVEANGICAAISRVLSAKQQWKEVLECAANPELNIIISNTTEVGIRLIHELISAEPPQSFPAKLLAFLHERFKKLGTASGPMVVLPTELISDNGKKLESIIIELAQYNNLEEPFFTWLQKTVSFCNTLVDCIVPGKPEPALHQQLEYQFGYSDALLTISEVYRLWAIEGGAEIRSLLSFAEADNRIVITPDITKYKELKLRLLNGTHTLSCGLAFLSGIQTVKEAMAHPQLSQFITQLMLEELAPAVPCTLAPNEAQNFGLQVLDRFRNPYLQHQWLSISMQYTSKMAMRTIPVLQRYYELYKKVPEHFALGFAAYLLFMKSVKQEQNTFFGESNGVFYPIKDDQAGYYFELWQSNDAEQVVHTVLRNEQLWNTDLSQVDGFEAAVSQRLHELIHEGALQTVAGQEQ
jgi:tagaturonate reductase